eukprot:COSAG06_NODE_2058_length_7708_cov_15.231042_4_plen_145_part_00
MLLQQTHDMPTRTHESKCAHTHTLTRLHRVSGSPNYHYYVVLCGVTGRLISFRSTRHEPPHLQQKPPFPSQLFLCLSRACLGKTIIYIHVIGSKKGVFPYTSSPPYPQAIATTPLMTSLPVPRCCRLEGQEQEEEEGEEETEGI